MFSRTPDGPGVWVDSVGGISLANDSEAKKKWLKVSDRDSGNSGRGAPARLAQPPLSLAIFSFSNSFCFFNSVMLR